MACRTPSPLAGGEGTLGGGDGLVIVPISQNDVL